VNKLTLALRAAATVAKTRRALKRASGAAKAGAGKVAEAGKAGARKLANAATSAWRR
jgi:hypothetical protein